jgi:transcriptional regulator with XRE-family HTH domain
MTNTELKAWRSHHGWTQEEAAAKIGISIDGYRQKEQGRRSITKRDIKQIADIDRLTAKKATKQ